MTITITPDMMRNGPHHRHIVYTRPITGTKGGTRCRLDCGHEVLVFGSIAHHGAYVLCEQCQTEATRKGQP